MTRTSQRRAATALAALLAAGLVGGASTAAGPRDFYSASGRALTVPYELELNEVQRDASRSVVEVAGFHERSAPGARWLICRYAELAQQRGFSHWNALYPEPGRETLVIGFSNDASATPEDLFGPGHARERVLAERMAPVDRYATLCGFRR